MTRTIESAQTACPAGLQPARVRFFGALIDPLTMEQTIRRVEGVIDARLSAQHVVVNVAKLVGMQKDAALRDAVNGCEIINADGQGIVWGARLLGLRLPERVAGIDLFLRLVERSAARGYRVYLLGATHPVVTRTAEALLAKHPGLQIAGYRDGYFKPEEGNAVAEAIREAKADLLFVAMTSPKKELFINRFGAVMQVPFMMGVGGSFDVVSGMTRRAPAWMQRSGLEWLFRLLQEPGRMWKRYVMTNAAFAGMILKALLRGKEKYAHAD